MINGMHALIYSTNADADRAFFRDVLGFPHVDTGEGWLIFKAPPAEIAFHPAEQHTRCELYLTVDDVESTVSQWSERGLEIIVAPTKREWGTEAVVRLPGGATLGVYQPTHVTAYSAA